MERLSKVNWYLTTEYGRINIVIELIFKDFRSEVFEFCKPGMVCFVPNNIRNW